MKENKKGGSENMGIKLIQLPQYQCERCGAEWLPRKNEVPRSCPKCRSIYWDRPRKNKQKSENKSK